MSEDMDGGLIFYDLGKLELALAQRDALVRALESIAGWREVNISGEYEHGLRDIIRSITDCAAAALDAASSLPDHRDEPSSAQTGIVP